MNRREALRALVSGGVAAAAAPVWVVSLTERGLAASLAAGQQGGAWSPSVFTARQNETVVTVAELIIPQTDTAGATAANVNRFIDTILADAPRAERRQFLSGLSWLDARSRELFGARFVEIPEAEQTALLTIISSPDNDTLADRPGVEFFAAIKRLTITGYYTSEVGMREELGDDGTRHFDGKDGCAHPEHRA